jgi:hypothetical protein
MGEEKCGDSPLKRQLIELLTPSGLCGAKVVCDGHTSGIAARRRTYENPTIVYCSKDYSNQRTPQ